MDDLALSSLDRGGGLVLQFGAEASDNVTLSRVSVLFRGGHLKPQNQSYKLHTKPN